MTCKRGVYYTVEGAGKEVYTNLAVVLKPTAIVCRNRNWEEKLHMKQERGNKKKERKEKKKKQKPWNLHASLHLQPQ